MMSKENDKNIVEIPLIDVINKGFRIIVKRGLNQKDITEEIIKKIENKPNSEEQEESK